MSVAQLVERSGSIPAPAVQYEALGRIMVALKSCEAMVVLARHWPELGLHDADDFTTAEALATIIRITSGNFRLTARLVAQIKRVLDINHLTVVTTEVVEADRESLVIGVL